MAIQPWSPQRLRDSSTLDVFVRVFSATNAEARGSEHERLQLVPLVFGLLPHASIHRQRLDERVKPAIRSHLGQLGVPLNEPLVNVLKEISDHYFEAVVRPDRSRARKLGLESVRALRRGAYYQLLERQAGRCAICGALLGTEAEETLDHIIPWALIGDPFDGSNWQLLCMDCNLGKREWLSVFQSPQALNWHYGIGDAPPVGEPTREARYIALATAGKCQARECTLRPREGKLLLRCRHQTGLAVVDNLVAFCERHAGGEVVAQEERVPSRPAPTSGSVRPKPPAARATLSSTPAPMLGSYQGYTLLKRVSGGMAEAFLAVDEETGEEVFLKRAAEGSEHYLALQRETQIYQKLNMRYAEHVPRVVDADRAEGFFYLVTERAETDLEQFVRDRSKLTTTKAKEILHQLLDGLTELHSMEVIHRDLKPSNILKVGERWVLADFGISKDLRGALGGATFQLRGTTGYAPPEQLMTGVEAKPTADVFALGKIVVFMLTGATDIDAVLFRKWRQLARSCTSDDADLRPPLDEIRRGLQTIDE